MNKKNNIYGFLIRGENMEELKKYYENVIENGKKYKELQQHSLNSDVALDIQKILDEMEYNVKLYHQTLIKKRQLTDEEKQMMEFHTPKEYTLIYFHTRRKYPALSTNLKQLIIKMKEREEKENEENHSICCNRNDDMLSSNYTNCSSI